MKRLGQLGRRVLLSFVLVPGLAVAQPAPQVGGESTARRHLGFFLRPELGYGRLDSGGDPNGGQENGVVGHGASVGVAVGGAVFENFILGGQAWGVFAPSPTVTVPSASVSTSRDTSASLVGFGPFLNWYFRGGAFVAVTPSLTRLAFDAGSSSASSWGFGVRANVGQEWWVSDRWGLGFSGGLTVSENRVPGTSKPTWATLAFNFGLSATLN